MSAPADTMTDSPFDRAAPPRPAPHATRPFFWSVRRELWENHAIWIAPLAVAALVVFGSLVAALGTHNTKTVQRTTAVAADSTQPGAAPATVVTTTRTSPAGTVTVQKTIRIPGPPPTPEQRRAMTAFPFYIVSATMLLTMFLVAVFYCLGGMYNERRDRSILFWKSLPVRDLTTVLSKIVVPMAILPVVTFVVALAAELLLLTIGILAFASHTKAAEDVSVPLGDIVAVLAYGLAALTLWWAPLYAWLLLVSGWAKRAPFLWAVLPPLGLALAEKLAFGTTRLGDLILSRVFGGYEVAFVIPKRMAPGMNPTTYSPQIDPAKFVSAPGLWIGLLVAAGLIAATVWMRRRREPI